MSQKSIVRKCGANLVACFPEKYDELLAVKVNRLQDLLSEVRPDSVPVEVFESPRSHFRMRANFNVWRDNPRDIQSNEFYYAMFDETDKKTPCEIVLFPRGSQKMNELMPALLDRLKAVPALYQHLFEVRFLTTSIDEASIVLIYKKPLPPAWRPAAEALATDLGAKIIGRSRKVKELVGEEAVREELEVLGKKYIYFHTEGAFSQPNAKVCQHMLEWASRATAHSQDQDLLELYCGGGTFTIALAGNFRKVLATEMSRASVELAVQAIAANAIENIKIARLTAEEFSEAYTTKRNFQRLIEANIKLQEYDTRTVLVDPPRAGLDADTCKLLSLFERIVYVSCNPETLARDLKVLHSTHKVVQVAAFDQFPYTHHLESGVLLVRRPSDELVPQAAPATAAPVSTPDIDTPPESPETMAVEVCGAAGDDSVLGKRKSDSDVN